MDAETNQNTPQEEDEEDSRATPERPPFSPLVPETNDNEVSVDTNSAGIKSEPPDNGRNEANQETQIDDTSVQSLTTEVQQTLPTVNESSKETETIISDIGEVRVKDEPDIEEANAIDYGMPLSKTPTKKSDNDMETTRLTANYTAIETQQGNTNETNSNNTNVSQSALDAFLDGIATSIVPVRPRLRVKTEFALLPPKTPQREVVDDDMLTLNKDCDNMDIDVSPPPPPPLISMSSSSNSEFLADGITTPRLSLAAINRLRVKSEFSIPPATPQRYNEDESSMPEDFFDDLLAKKDIDKEAGEVSSSNSEEDDDNIPDDFFDDLLRDNLKEKIEEAKNNELEEKYSDRLKEYERLQKELKKLEEKSREKRRNRKKLRKAKKKSRKRSRSRSVSPSKRTKENISSHDRNKRSRISPPARKEISSTVHVVNRASVADGCLRVDKGIKVKSEFSASDFDNVTTECTSVVENVEEIEEVLTPKQKRERAVHRATALLNHLKDCSTSENNSSIFSTFPFVSTVRKLPTSHSYVQQRIYENRSPLHTVNNVSYKFNSHTTRFNMEEWGLAALTTHAAKMAKLVGCDAQFIHTKLKTIKIPAKLKKVKQEPTSDEAKDEEEDLQETTSSLHSHAMTQTDDLAEFNKPHKTQVNEVGVQVEPSVYSIGSQTLETQSPKKDSLEDDAPIMKIIRDLNENQLMAIHQFAELIREPNTNSSAIEMYKMQMQILEIYKISQIPSALATPQTQAVNSYTTTKTNSPPKHRGTGYRQREYIQQDPQQQQPIIQAVRGADGSQFSINDPRARSAAYAKRNVNDGAGSSSNYDPRIASFSQTSHERISTNQGYSQSSQTRSSGSEDRHYTSTSNPRTSRQYPSNNQAVPNQAPPTTNKFYGRGGLRRS
ncbi:uncharacterized protein Panx [Calliphora vicina]|uniref:uncharacterized protein Panx n=1 Tax=Calliphora vicina TaxID=7373 RepID=UPI00325B0E19